MADDQKMGKSFFLKLRVNSVKKPDLTSTQHMLYSSIPSNFLYNKQLFTFVAALNYHRLKLSIDSQPVPDPESEDPQPVSAPPPNDFLITCA